MNEHIIDMKGRTWVTDRSVGGQGSVGVSNEQIILAEAEGKGLSIGRGGGTYKSDSEVLAGLGCDVYVAEYGYGGNAVYVRESEAAADLLKLFKEIEEYPALDDMAWSKLQYEWLQNRWDDEWRELSGSVPEHDLAVFEAWCGEAGMNELDASWKICAELNPDFGIFEDEGGSVYLEDGRKFAEEKFAASFHDLVSVTPGGEEALQAAEAAVAAGEQEEPDLRP